MAGNCNKHNIFFRNHVSVCKCQRFLSVRQMPEISVCTSNARNSIMDAMPSTIAILSTIVKGLDAMPSTIITQDKGPYIECKCLCMHSCQRLCTANLGSKSLDGFFYVFHSLSSKEPFPGPAAWKVVRL